ncbi:TetR/AcrR family transcriptional regulator [Burkholderia seminalis]|uniref:TetR/AcrR family transcriptional regulator n=2 Tax=Burkholderia cepacia complex TaxID=87882 RepID=A0A8A8CQH1_9BURK|nr:TetR/AcrR family transcriptional regulator [Burkholderia seminalis]QTO17543.1 TetR/AcrR family transcriptional regulator [Burkholderia seminalis]
MGVAERKNRDREAREQRITAAARQIAEAEGWSAVTVRRLADEIEYSQPVLYSHFRNRDAIVGAVALEGFREIKTALHQAAQRSTDSRQACESVAIAYLDFARDNPALYEAMFTMPTDLLFAEADTRPELREAFEVLAAVVPSSLNVDVATETFWATLHGLAQLESSGRIKHSTRLARVALVIRGLFG